MTPHELMWRHRQATASNFANSIDDEVARAFAAALAPGPARDGLEGYIATVGVVRLLRWLVEDWWLMP